MRKHARPFRRVPAALAAAGVALALVAVVVAVGPQGRPGLAAHAAEPPLVEIHAAHGASYVPALEGKRPLFILVLGSDARQGEQVARLRADSIHIVGINLRQRKASILGFPRDSYVPIPGHGSSKINNAMTFGGPQLMVSTVERLTGIRMDFWLLTSFKGLRQMVDAVGGVTVKVPYPMHDPYSGANFRAGPQRMGGAKALAFARNRHDTPNGDFSRSLNQGVLMLSALTELRKDFGKSPTVLFRWIAALWRGVQSDLPAKTLFDLALTATQVRPSSVKNVVVPGSTGTAGGASVVFISGSARQLYNDIRRDGVIG
jgi:polyisoprenyl-teichoic acid--peptidoglycan teichoic acid transferase